MKKAIYTLSLSLFAALALSSCGKGDYSTGVDYGNTPNPFYDDKGAGANQSHGNFTAKISGSDFSGQYTYAYKNDGTSISYIAGYSGNSAANGQGIMMLPNSLDAGTYTVGSSLTAMYQAVGSATPAIMSSGTLTITENTGTHIKGTFDLHTAGVDITDGAFDLDIAKPAGM